MGISYMTYIGPYLEVEQLNEGVSPSDLDFCSDMHCQYDADDKVGPFYFHPAWKRVNAFGREMEHDTRGGMPGADSFTPEQIVHEKKVFIMEYAKSIDKIRKEAGPTVLRWGVLHWVC